MTHAALVKTVAPEPKPRRGGPGRDSAVRAQRAPHTTHPGGGAARATVPSDPGAHEPHLRGSVGSPFGYAAATHQPTALPDPLQAKPEGGDTADALESNAGQVADHRACGYAACGKDGGRYVSDTAAGQGHDTEVALRTVLSIGYDNIRACAPGKDTAKDPPAPLASGSGTGGSGKSLSVYLVSLPGSSRDPVADVARANTVWATCSLKINVAGGQSWQTDVLNKLSPTSVLNEYSSPSSPTTEETELLAHRPGGNSAVHVYFVPAMSAGSRGEAFWPAVAPTLPGAVVVSDSAASDTFAHELGHVVLNDGGHHTDPDNLMATGAIRNVGVDKLDAAQCSKV